ncbi:hypothetical protein NM208_g8672 [Fusarium decemcellulare]|uniref:Uncharacterized protein n=1 Tax=Fusarium decemcellulare TaxID=57161 RepID=A0ACC1S4L0_9HYPO|nr:hypothetical protein NM208_g8672 [Fusarium decemcellulare]
MRPREQAASSRDAITGGLTFGLGQIFQNPNCRPLQQKKPGIQGSLGVISCPQHVGFANGSAGWLGEPKGWYEDNAEAKGERCSSTEKAGVDTSGMSLLPHSGGSICFETKRSPVPQTRLQSTIRVCEKGLEETLAGIQGT